MIILIFNRLIKTGSKSKRWNPIKECTLLQYSLLEDTSIVDLALKHTKPSSKLLTSGIYINPKEESIQDLTLREVISIRNKLDVNDIEGVVKKVYCISDLSEVDVYSYSSVCKWIIQEIEKIESKEKRLSSKNDKEAWRAAGIDKLGAFGRYASLAMISKDILQENSILDMPYYRVFDRMEYDKIFTEVQAEFYKIKSKK